MMRPADPPPRGLGWTVSPFGRVVSLTLAVIALGLSVYVNVLRIELAECLADRDLADQKRTAAIAAATDDERLADLALLKGAHENEFKRDELRKLTIKAREHTDRVRLANPAPKVRPCT